MLGLCQIWMVCRNDHHIITIYVLGCLYMFSVYQAYINRDCCRLHHYETRRLNSRYYRLVVFQYIKVNSMVLVWYWLLMLSARELEHHTMCIYNNGIYICLFTGWLYDVSGNYLASYITAGAAIFLSGAILYPVPYIENKLKLTKSRTWHAWFDIYILL